MLVTTKSKNIRLLFLIVIVFTIQCSQYAPTQPKDFDVAPISASIKFAHKAFSAESLTKIVLEVSGEGIETFTKELTMQAGGARGQVEVPVGKTLTFKATAYLQSAPMLTGSTDFKAEKGKKNNLQIVLDFMVPALILTPPDSIISKNTSFTIYLQARKTSNLGTIGTKILFDKNKLQVVDLGREDAFLKSNSGSINQLSFTKDNSTGVIDIVLGVFPSSSAVSGDGKLARIVFKAVEVGVAGLAVSLDNATNSDLGLFDKNANLIQALPLGSTITIQ